MSLIFSLFFIENLFFMQYIDYNLVSLFLNSSESLPTYTSTEFTPFLSLIQKQIDI